MSLKRGKIFRFIFIIYFSFYALSPLCYTVSRLDEVPTVKEKTNYTIKCIRLFLGELIWSNLVEKKETTDDSDRVLLLIRKARAILKLNDNFKIIQKYAIATENVFVLPVTQFSAALIPVHLSPYNGFLSLFSGLSPPFPPQH